MPKENKAKPKDIEVGEKTTFYGYPIEREASDEYKVSIYADDLKTAQEVIKRCLEAGIIEWPIQAVGRRRR